VAAKDELGRAGEKVAVDYLQEQGLVVLNQNWRCGEGELDIVALEPWIKQVVFCEVKTRSGLGYGDPLESITYAKRRKVRRLAQLWLQANTNGYASTRFDVIGVLWLPERKPVIDHRPRAF
jgi:putative endonuclease